MLSRKHGWTRKFMFLIVLSMIINPIIVHATGVDEIVVFGSGYSVSEDYSLGNVGLADDINADEIWAQIDREELRSYVDEDIVKNSVDKEALLTEINLDELMAQIDLEAIEKEVDSDSHPLDVVNVKFPIIGESSPFDFFIDPQGLIYATDAARYGGGRVEEGAGILFRNTDSEYLFSSKSDMITVVNHSNVPVRLTVQASITDPENIDFVNSRGELYGETPSIYMAIGDDEGIRAIMTEQGDAVVDVVLEAAPEGTYNYAWDEEKQKYEYEISKDAGDEDFDSYSFYITADCNTESDWRVLNGAPRIAVSWKTEAVKAEEKKSNENEGIIAELDTMVKEYLGIGKETAGKAEAEEKSEEQIRDEKITELAYQKLYKLALDQFTSIYNAEVAKLTDAEVEKLANARFKEILQEMGEASEPESEVSDEPVDEVIESDDQEPEEIILERATEPVVRQTSEQREEVEASSNSSEEIIIFNDTEQGIVDEGEPIIEDTEEDIEGDTSE